MRQWGLVVLGLCLWAPGISAATLSVAQDGSGQFTTVMAAVAQSQPGDVVVISAGLYAEHVVVGHSLTLEGQGGVILDGSGTGSVLHATGGTLSLVGLTLQGGEAPFGGGILAEGADVNLHRVELLFNHAGEGGGLYQRGGTLSVSQGVVEGNVADVGGGIYLNGGVSARVEASQFVHNRGLEGSALRVVGVSAQVSNNLFLENGYTAEGEPQLLAMPAYFVVSDGAGTHITNNSFVRSGCCNMALLSRAPVLVRNNLLIGGAGYGLALGQGTVGSAGETRGITYNNFYNNKYGDVLTQSGEAARHCRVPGEDLVGTGGNIGVAPQFVKDDPAGPWRSNDYHLQGVSLSMDAGGRRPGEKDPDGSRNDQGMYGGPGAPELPSLP